MLRSKLREGTEVIVTFPPERVMSALEPIREQAAKESPTTDGMNLSAEDRAQLRRRPMFRVGE